MSGQSGGQRLRLSKLNDQLTCRLCGGYFIDATTIIECLHSFCRSCIVKYLENNKYCPICEVQVHKSRPLLNIRPDHTLQDIVYKLVPACYQNEMRCRREFYAKHPEACGQGMSPESRGEPTESHIYSPDESLSLSLEYFNPGTKDSNNTSSSKDISSKPLLRRYLRCPAAVTVFHLQKLIRAKYGLTDAHRVDVMYKEEPLCSSYTLMDVMYIYHWRRKVPLHLSYRIFESSPKRIKLSEDNVNYKTSLLHAGIDSVDEKGDDPDKKEWKEVQLKISETGVMSITDISNSQSKEPIRIEHIHEQQKCPEKEISCVEDTKNNSKENLNADGKVEPAPISENTSQTDDSNKVASLNDKTVAPQQQVTVALKVVTNTSNHVNDQSNSSKVSANEKPPASIKFTQSVQNEAVVSENPSVGTRVSQRQQIQAASRESSRTPDEKTLSAKETEKEDKQLSRNNNNNNNNNNNTIGGDGKLDIRKQTTKGTASEAKVMNAGSKIDALSAKLQFQPKVGQVNNTLSKKIAKDKKAPTQVTKRIESRTENTVKQSENKPVESTPMKTRPNSSNMNNKTSPATAKNNSTKSGSTPTSDDTPASSSNTTRYVSTVVPTSTEMDFTCKESTANKSPQSNPVQSTRHEKSPVIGDRKPNSREQVSTEPSKTGQSSTTKSQKSNLIHNEASKGAQTTSLSGSVDTRPKETSPTVSQSIPVSCSVSQAISSFAYTVQDLVNNAMLKGSLKNLAAAQSTMSGCNIQEHPVCSVPQFTMQQAQSMSMQQATSSLKNNYVAQNISPSCPTTRQQSKLNLEITTGVYTVPPCPDAIPISLMKPTIRKSEVITKGTNLNEICAKIGASGSKINDICAKIGENSKERNKTETRNKPEIPDLLKIARRNSPPSGSSESKHSNIPNVPVYTPSNSTITTENTSVYSNVKDSLRSTSLSTSSASVATSQASMQKASNTKKQNQIVGYKTLRESPRCWNPTLSKNNYIAVKNQTKEVQNQLQSPNMTDRNKPIQSKPAKIFKVRNVPRYLGNPASGVKPMYGIGNDTKEKDQAATISKSTSLNMMKIDPKTLSPIVSTSNSPIVSPPPYSPSARNYQNTPFSRDMCRSTGSPISPKNSPVNMLSTNPFIPSPTPNTNPRLIYSHFPPPFPDATRFPNPLIRSPIGIPPPSAFHSSLPPSINKLYQRSSYIPQTTGFPQVSQPPTVQRIPPSSYSSPKSPKTTSLTAISSPSFSIPKTDTQLPTTTSIENVAFLLSENVKPHDDANVFNLSKTGNVSSPSSFLKNSSVDTTIDIQNQKSGPVAISAPSTSVSKQSTVCTSNVTGTSISTATTTTPVVTTSSTSTASVTVPLSVASVSTSVAVSTSTFTSTSTSMTLAEASTQIEQMSKTKSQVEQCDSRLSGKNEVEKEGEKDKEKDRESEQTKGSVNCKEDNCNISSVPSTDKERNPETSEDVSQEKKDKTNSQVNGDVQQLHTESSNSTKEATATSQCNKDTAEKSAREQTNSHSAPQYPSDKPAVKQQSEQQKQPALASKDTLKEAAQVHNKSETQAKNAET